jgi:hypothetical protein
MRGLTATGPGTDNGSSVSEAQRVRGRGEVPTAAHQNQRYTVPTRVGEDRLDSADSRGL